MFTFGRSNVRLLLNTFGLLVEVVLMSFGLARNSLAMGCGTETNTGIGNVSPMVVDGFPCKSGGKAGEINWPQVPYVSVKICSPGSLANCQVIDHVIVDSGSTGLRVAYSALSPKLRSGFKKLPLKSSFGKTLTECEAYISSYVYGPIAQADVHIAGESARNTQLQIFGHPRYRVTRDCKRQGGDEMDSTQSFGGNGLIGVSFYLRDDHALYYNCQPNTSFCKANTTFPGIPNTVSQFATNNNGAVLSFPPLSTPDSSTPIEGTLAFGISTQSNNTPGVNTLALLNDGGTTSDSGTFEAKIGSNWSNAYIDSGTDTVYFYDDQNSALKACPSTSYYAGWYCPLATQHLTFNLADAGTTKTQGYLHFTVANPRNTFTSSTIAYDNIGGVSSPSSNLDNSMAFGLSVFFGNKMYFLFNDQKASTFGTLSGRIKGPINGIEPRY